MKKRKREIFLDIIQGAGTMVFIYLLLYLMFKSLNCGLWDGALQ